MDNYKIIEAQELQEMIENHKLFINSGGYGGKFTTEEVNGELQIKYSKQGSEGKMFDIRKRCIPEGTILSREELSYGIFSDSICKGVHFNHLSLQGCLMNDADFEGSNFYNGYCYSSDLSNSNLKNSSFIDIYLSDVDFKGANCENTTFVAVDVEGVKNIRLPKKNYTQTIKELKEYVDTDEEKVLIKQDIIEKLKDVIDEDEVFMSSPLVSESGSSGGTLYQIIDNKRERNDKAKEIDKILRSTKKSDLIKPFSKGTTVQVFFEKSKVTVNPLDIKGLVSVMAQRLSEGKIDYDKIINPELRNTETTFEYFAQDDDVEVEAITTEYYPEEEKTSSEPISIGDLAESLYYSLEEKVEKINLVYKDCKLTVKTVPPFPEYGYEEYVEDFELPELDSTDITGLCTLLESTNRTQINHAIGIASRNTETTEFIKKRYFTLVKARLNVEEVTLSHLEEGLLNKVESKFLLETHKSFLKIGKDFLSFSYCNDFESKLLVDFIGSLVHKHIRIDDFINEAQLAPDEKKLISVFKKYAAKVRKGLKAELGFYPEGWYEELVSRLLKLKMTKLLFEKTSFNDANNSLYIKGFVFFMGMMSSSSIYMDIFQSDAPDFTEVFWMLKDLPDVSFTESEFTYPAETLSFKR